MYHHHLHMVCISNNSFDALEHDLWSIFESRQAIYANKLFCWNFNSRKFFGRYNDLVCPYNLPLVKCCPTCFKTIVKPFFFTTDCYVYPIKNIGSRRVWPVKRGCLPLLDIWSHLWLIPGSVFILSFLVDYEIGYGSLSLPIHIYV